MKEKTAWYNVDHWRGHRHLVAVVIVLAAVLVRMEFLPSLGLRAPYITFYPAVIVAALLGGLVSGLLATALSAMAVALLLLEPMGRFRVGDPTDLQIMGIFVASGVMVSWISETMHHAQTRVITAKAELRLAVEREQAAAKLQETQRLLNSLVEGTLDAIYLKDRRGCYLLFNSAAERITGKRAEEVMGMDDTAIFSPARQRW
ncbi:DUF4118 domain-containing protein [Geobacter pickeringii]|uniref:PAS domain-containing protein n=1 Tax=Geobacter pickeringii TaxID=345632 RepID=A0A0B5BDW2_9BACT|nr:DUF4118 domain-containing protein [Geobacter pickeringii]AJE04662.1 hypothetical protein GPICK_15945 [Geobacter pickeringii]